VLINSPPVFRGGQIVVWLVFVLSLFLNALLSYRIVFNCLMILRVCRRPYFAIIKPKINK